MPDRIRDDIALMLEGGDLRSIGRANEVAAIVRGAPGRFPELFACIFSNDPVVAARAADATEKASAGRPELLASHRRELLEKVAAMSAPEIRWHVAQMLPRLDLDRGEREEAVDILRGYLNDRSSIVRTFAMQGLFDLAMSHRRLLPMVTALLEDLAVTGTPAMRSRGRILLEKIPRS